MNFDVKGGRPAAEHVFKTAQLYQLAESLEVSSRCSNTPTR